VTEKLAELEQRIAALEAYVSGRKAALAAVIRPVLMPRDEEIVGHYETSHSMRATAQHFGLHPITVKRALRRGCQDEPLAVLRERRGVEAWDDISDRELSRRLGAMNQRLEREMTP
jgi:IS30 family transposase